MKVVKDTDTEVEVQDNNEIEQQYQNDSLANNVSKLLQLSQQQLALFIHANTLKDNNNEVIEEIFIFGWVKLFDDLFENEATKDAFELISSNVEDYVKTYKFNFLHNEEYTFSAVIDMTIGFEIKLIKELKVIEIN